jgi:hypothetical protein
MTKAPKIELRGIKHTGWASEETHCYTATLHVDGERWGTVSNNGHGGCDDFHGVNGKTWDDIAALNAVIAATYPPITVAGAATDLKQDLEIVCAELVNEWLRERDFARAMKSKVIFTKPGQAGVWQISVKKPYTLAATLDAVREKHPDYTFLADLPAAQAKAIYFAA